MSLRHGSECSHVVINSSAGTTVAVAAVATQRVYIYRMIFTLGTPAATLVIQDTSGGALSQVFQLAINGAITLDSPNNDEPWWTTGTGLGVQFVQSGTTPYGCDLWYIQGV